MKRAVFIGALVFEIALALVLFPRTNSATLRTTDFVNFYAGATLVRQGRGAVLYRRETQDAVFQSILGHKSNQYFLHPPFEAAALAPLSYLRIERAFVVWTLFNAGLLALLPLLLMPCVPLVAQRPYLGLLGLAFFPALTALTLGQDSILLLFILSASYLLLCKKLDAAAGMVLAMAAIKFQYLVILVPFLLLWRRFRLMAGFAGGAALLVFISFLITGMDGLIEYVRFVRTFDLHSGYGGLNPTLMVNWRGFLAGTGNSSPIYFWAGEIILLSLGLLCVAASEKTRTRGLTFALFISIAVEAAPYAHFEDMTLLLLPILLAWDYVHDSSARTVGTGLIAFSCGALFLWPLLLVFMGGHYWWNSRIYLTFPVILLFIAGLVAELLIFAEPGTETVPAQP
jgi:hypothetical protein